MPYVITYRVTQKEFKRLVGYGIKSVWPLYITKILFFQSKAYLDEKILFGKISHHLDPEIRKLLVRRMFGNGTTIFHPGPIIYLLLKFKILSLKLTM